MFSRQGGAVFFFQAEDGIRDRNVTGVQTCALPISAAALGRIEFYQGDGPLPAQSAAAFRPGGVRQKERQHCGRDTHGPWSKRRPAPYRSEERRVGKECRSPWAPRH